MVKAKSRSQEWTFPENVRQQVQRLWDRGDLLRCVLGGLAVDDIAQTVPDLLVFPYRLHLKKPASNDMGKQFSQVRIWIDSLSSLRHTRLELLEVRHPQLGRNSVPKALWVDSLRDALALIGKHEESRRFSSLVQELAAHDTRLVEWVKRRPVKVLELESAWSRLLRVHERISKRRGDQMYLRQLSVTGVDTKFIETHRGVLTEWLDLTLPASYIDDNYRGSRGFVRRYGFKDKPARLRLRSLDSSQPLLGRIDTQASEADVLIATADITLDVDVIRSLDPAHVCVVITENEINYLALPERNNTLAIFGSGYGLQSLGDIDWLGQRDVWYWGDIDTHGFAILNELRNQLPDVRSLMMDRDTLMAHESLWGNESSPANRSLERLNDDEVELYRDIVEHRYADCVRLEQEQIDYAWMLTRLEVI